ncbi:hypothetical protein IFM89_032557 [Coptis chinensis]|uniref:Uncharacterized protein n=1 Tax=Coptis chinensis TaxID=261450 RepID=A0A835I6B0_9MAGN|nr:hypothetical protein IFM89_032557 [Coptis chinensis]
MKAVIACFPSLIDTLLPLLIFPTALWYSTSNDTMTAKSVIRPIKTGPKKQGNKLYERRNSFKNFKVSPLMYGLVQNCGFSPRELEMLSPSILDFPSLVISPDTPLTQDPFNRSPTTYTTSKLSLVDQGRIIEKGFYLHSSPIASPRDSVPRLLLLFPMTSPIYRK